MMIGLLGPVVAHRRDGEPVSLGGPKQRAVLAILALQPRTPVSADALADAIWGEALPPRPHRTLSVYVSTLRASLGGPGPERTRVTLRTSPGGYLLDIPDRDIDVARFQDGVAKGRSA